MRNRIRRLDLKTKITAASVGLFVVAIWLLAHDVAEEVWDDFQAVTGTQQLALVEHIVDSLDEDANLRINTLKDIASQITPEMMDDPNRIRAMLRQDHHRLFDNGFVVISKSGLGLIDDPPIRGRAETNFADEDFFQRALKTADVVIGRPRVSRFSEKPVMLMVARILNPAREISGVLVGSMSISDNSFFNEIIPRRQRLDGWFHLVSPNDRIFIASTHKDRILQPIPEPGNNLLLDRFVQGYEGTGVTINSRGVETLSSSMHMASTGWLVVSSMPTKVAFAPIISLQREIYQDAAISSILIAVLLWVYIYRQLMPLSRSADILDEMANGSRPLSPLPVDGSGEIRRLLGSFNQFQGRISQQKQSLRDNAEQLELAASVFDGTSESIVITDADNKIIIVNKSFCRMTGYEIEEFALNRWRGRGVASAS